MHKHSPFYYFSRNHLSYLYRCRERGDVPTKADLRRILENDPEAETDPLMIRYLRDDAIGRLKRKRGRKKQSPQLWLQTSALSIIVPWRAEEIREERKTKGEGIDRYDLSPMKQAAEDYARSWKLGSGLSLLNRISAQKKHDQLL